MKKIKVVEISQKLNVSHSAVSQWFNGTTKPTANNMFLLEDNFQIPLSAWRDIKSYFKKYTKDNINKSNTQNNEEVSV